MCVRACVWSGVGASKAMKKAGGNVDGSCVGVGGVGGVGGCVAVVAAVAAVVVDVGKATSGACWKMEHAGKHASLGLAGQSPLYSTVALRSTVNLNNNVHISLWLTLNLALPSATLGKRQPRPLHC